MSKKLDIKGLDELLAKLGIVETARFVQPRLKAGATSITNRLKRYPPSSNANLPGKYPKRWYQRGYGPRWALKKGGAGGKKTSQRLGSRWTQSVYGLRAVIGNAASYAPYVQGESQARFHNERGWEIAEEAADAELPSIVERIGRDVENILSS